MLYVRLTESEIPQNLDTQYLKMDPVIVNPVVYNGQVVICLSWVQSSFYSDFSIFFIRI